MSWILRARSPQGQMTIARSLHGMCTTTTFPLRNRETTTWPCLTFSITTLSIDNYVHDIVFCKSFVARVLNCDFLVDAIVCHISNKAKGCTECSANTDSDVCTACSTAARFKDNRCVGNSTDFKSKYIYHIHLLYGPVMEGARQRGFGYHTYVSSRVPRPAQYL